MISFSPCPECGGSGKVGPIATDQDTWRFDPCPKCGGLGVEISDELVEAGKKFAANWQKLVNCPNALYDHNPDACECGGYRYWMTPLADEDISGFVAAVVAHLRDGTKGTE